MVFDYSNESIANIDVRINPVPEQILSISASTSSLSFIGVINEYPLNSMLCFSSPRFRYSKMTR